MWKEENENLLGTKIDFYRENGKQVVRLTGILCELVWIIEELW